MLCWLLVLLPAVVLGLAGRGSPAIVLNITSARSSPTHPLKVDPFTLWCGADNTQVEIRKASFVKGHGGKRVEAVVDKKKRNATLAVVSATVDDAGEYVCEMETNHGKISHIVNVYARPVASFVNDQPVAGDDPFKLTAPGLYVASGVSVNLSCSVVSHPPATFIWTKDGKPLEMSDVVELDGSTLRISKTSEKDAGLYGCEALNEMTQQGKTVRTLLTIHRELSIKGELAWLWPLLVILAILVLLVIFIAVCEMKKKNSEKQSRYVVQE